MGKKFWWETLHISGVKFRSKILSPGQNFRIWPFWSHPNRKYRIGIFGHRAARTGIKIQTSILSSFSYSDDWLRYLPFKTANVVSLLNIIFPTISHLQQCVNCSARNMASTIHSRTQRSTKSSNVFGRSIPFCEGREVDRHELLHHRRERKWNKLLLRTVGWVYGVSHLVLNRLEQQHTACFVN